MFRNVFLFSVAFSAISIAATAQEAPSGLYVGTGVGYSNQKVKFDFSTPSDFSSNDDDTVITLFGGYNYKLNGPWFVGAEAGLDIAAFGVRGPSSIAFGVNSPDFQLNFSGRAGRIISDNFLAYAKASYSHLFIDSIKDFDGYGLGGGGEFRLTDKWWLRAEYTYTDLGHSPHRTGASFGLENIGLSSHQVVASAIFRL